MTTVRRSRDTRGMTLIEMLIALVVFSVVLASALTFLGRQGGAFRLGSERMDVLQNLRFAATTLSNDLRTAGSNVPDQQPQLVYAGATLIAFNADYATNVVNDAWAVYHDPDAPTGAVTALRTAQQITLPGTAFQYPAVNYTYQGANSPAEFLIFYFTPDASTTRTDDYILYRRVNEQAPAMIARNLLQTPGVAFFQYYRLRTPANAAAFIAAVPSGELPLSHSVSFHLSPADTGTAARIDSLRGVQISFTATNGLTGARERRGALTRLVRFPNAGFATRRTCGDEPLLGAALVAAPFVLASGDPAIRLTWNAATDETAGEKDVMRYVVWRRIAGAVDWGDPYLSVPAGSAQYTWDDEAVVTGVLYEYALAAQDCTPSQSTLALAGPVLAP
jgi:prepilin-type N-terminal cleavage/methylation domain-containing protein